MSPWVYRRIGNGWLGDCHLKNPSSWWFASRCCLSKEPACKLPAGGVQIIGIKCRLTMFCRKQTCPSWMVGEQHSLWIRITRSQDTSGYFRQLLHFFVSHGKEKNLKESNIGEEGHSMFVHGVVLKSLQPSPASTSWHEDSFAQCTGTFR